MAEKLGDALLALRTDDTQFDAGIARAEGKARRLGGTLDKTTGSSTKLATEMTRTGRSAAAMGNAFTTSGQRVVASAASQRAGMQQLGFQISDVATMYSLGARPTQIFASQIGQITQAVQLATGGTSRFAAFLGGPWGIAVTAGTIVLAPMIARLFETEQAMEAVELASDGMADAQGVLAEMFDTTTGALKNQNEQLRLNAQLMAINLRAEAESKAARSRSTFGNFADGRIGLSPGQNLSNALGLTFGSTAGTVASAGRAEAVRSLMNQFQSGKLSPTDAAKQAAQLNFDGLAVNKQEFLQAIADGFSSSAMVETAEKIEQSLSSGQLHEDFIDPAKGRNGRTRKGPTQAELDARFESQMIGVTQQILRARAELATNAEDRAELEARMVEWDRREALADIESDEKLNDAQKEELSAAVTRLADIELETIEFRKRIALEREAQQMADEIYEARREQLQLQFQLADTEAERKRLALAMLDAEEAYLRSKLQAVILSDTANDAERMRARVAMDAMDATAAQRRDAVARANETTAERYMRDLNKTPAQINEAIDQIKIDGLEAFNRGLVDAIVNFRNLGDVAHSILKQILADILMLQIRQNLTGPLAGMMGLGGGGMGGGGGMFGFLGGFFGSGASPQASLVPSVNSMFADPGFAGLFADGGHISRGQWGIVGEAGPEPVFATASGVGVLPNSALRAMPKGGGGDRITIPQTFLIPERSDPRRTKSSVDRGTQQALGVASRKNLA